MKVTGNHDKILKENKRTFNSWFEAWLIFHVPKTNESSKIVPYRS